MKKEISGRGGRMRAEIETNSGTRTTRVPLPGHRAHAFANPFKIEDLLIFDACHLGQIIIMSGMRPEHLAWAVREAPSALMQHIDACLPEDARTAFWQGLASPGTK